MTKTDPSSGFVVAPITVAQVNALETLVAHAVTSGYGLEQDSTATKQERYLRKQRIAAAHRALKVLKSARRYATGRPR